MAIYDYKEFLTFDDVADYLTDKGIYNFDLSYQENHQKLKDFLLEWARLKKITPVFYNKDSVVDVISYQYESDHKRLIKYNDGGYLIRGYYGIDLFTYEYILTTGVVRAKYEAMPDDDEDYFIQQEYKYNKEKIFSIDWTPYKITDSYKPKILEDCFVSYELFADGEAVIYEKDLFYPKAELDNLFLQRQKDNLQQQMNTIDSQLDELTDNSKNSYLITIGLLLELLKTPKGFDKDNKPNKPLFDSNNQIIQEILGCNIYGQGKSTLENRFGEANKALDQAKKK